MNFGTVPVPKENIEKKTLLQRITIFANKINKLNNEIETLPDLESGSIYSRGFGSSVNNNQFESIKQKLLENQKMINTYIDHIKFLKSIYNKNGDLLLAEDCVDKQKTVLVTSKLFGTTPSAGTTQPVVTTSGLFGSTPSVAAVAAPVASTPVVAAPVASTPAVPAPVAATVPAPVAATVPAPVAPAVPAVPAVATTQPVATTPTDTPTTTLTQLIPQKDSIGFYYECENMNGKLIKFYYELDSAKLSTKLNSIDDFPQWCDEIFKFCKSWELSKTGSIYEVNKNAGKLLFNVLSQSLGDEMQHYKIECSTGLLIFTEISDAFTTKYSSEVKDKLWAKIKVDEWCPEPYTLRTELTKLLNIETHCFDTIAIPRKQEEILRKKIRSCMTDSLIDKVMLYASQLGKLEIWELPPTAYLFYFITYLNHRKSQVSDENIYNECNQCKSKYHIATNCP